MSMTSPKVVATSAHPSTAPALGVNRDSEPTFNPLINSAALAALEV